MTQSGNGNDGPRRRNHPIDSVRWVPRSVVHANEYNPNRQVDENHALLIESIRADGWTQPIVVRPRGDDGMHVIVDGEHRWRAAAHLDDDHIPVVILDQDDAGCIAATVRHNRARGSHGVENMAHIITRLRAEGTDSEAIEAMLGMTHEERSRLETSEDVFLALMGGGDQSMSS